MNHSNISQLVVKRQDTKEGSLTMKGLHLTTYIHSIIREYGVIRHGSYSLLFEDLPLQEKKIFLSRIYDSHSYEWSCENSIRLNEVIYEESNYMQSLIDKNLNEIYREDMEEMSQSKDMDDEKYGLAL